MNTSNGVEQKQRSVNARPETWERFKLQTIEEGLSPAARLGQLIEHYLDPPPASIPDDEGLSQADKQLIWAVLHKHSRTMKQDTRESLAAWQTVIELRDRFADAYDPPKATLHNPHVPAG